MPKIQGAKYAQEASKILWLALMCIAPIITAWALALKKGGIWWLVFLAIAIGATLLGSRAKRRLEELVLLSRAAKEKRPNQSLEPTRADARPADEAPGPRGSSLTFGIQTKL